MRGRPGTASLPELVLVATLFALVLASLARFAAAQGRMAAAQRDRVRLEEAARTVAVVLGGELRYLATHDLAAMSADSLRIRAFRGGGPVCAREEAAIWVRYRGARLPEPAKDSVVLLSAGADRVAMVSAAVWSPRCDGSQRLLLDPPPQDTARYALVFETGSYVLSGGALRYRRGMAGRQPLTEAILADPGFEPAPGAVWMRLAGDPDSLPRLPAAPRRVRATPRNGPVPP